MSVCPTVSVLRFYGCCHPCFLRIHLCLKLSNLRRNFWAIKSDSAKLSTKKIYCLQLTSMYEMKKKHAFITKCVHNFNQ